MKSFVLIMLSVFVMMMTACTYNNERIEDPLARKVIIGSFLVSVFCISFVCLFGQFFSDKKKKYKSESKDYLGASIWHKISVLDIILSGVVWMIVVIASIAKGDFSVIKQSIVVRILIGGFFIWIFLKILASIFLDKDK